MSRDFREANGMGIQFQHMSFATTVVDCDDIDWPFCFWHLTALRLLSQETQAVTAAQNLSRNVNLIHGRIPGDSTNSFKSMAVPLGNFNE